MATRQQRNLYLGRWDGGGVNYQTWYFRSTGQAQALKSAQSCPPRCVPPWMPTPVATAELVANDVRRTAGGVVL